MTEPDAPLVIPPDHGDGATAHSHRDRDVPQVAGEHGVDGVEEVERAVAMLAARVAKLEAGVPESGAGVDGANALPALVNACKGLKVLRTMIVTAGSQWSEERKERDRLREQNAKLQYQITHLKRSLEAAES